VTRIRLHYVHEFRDRHGKIRRYFRSRNGRRVPLPGLPGSPEFNAAYETAVAGIDRPLSVGGARTTPGTVNAAIVAYYNSDAFRNGLKHATQRMRRNILEAFRAKHGEKRIATLPTPFLVSMLAGKKPFAARNWLKALRGLLQFAVLMEMRKDDPTASIKLRPVKTDRIATWSEAEIDQFEGKHPIGSKARLAFALALYTAQRRSDLVRMGKQHVRHGVILVRQEKTGTRLEIPIHPHLQTVMDATKSDHLTFLTTARGEPFSAASFGNMFRQWCTEAELPKHCSAHGLRKAACRRLAEAGCSTSQIAAISGHASLSEVQRYTKAADQARLARDAMRTVQGETRTSIGKPE
jgi:integrase